jgi:hypothetical protein
MLFKDENNSNSSASNSLQNVFKNMEGSDMNLIGTNLTNKTANKKIEIEKKPSSFKRK